MTAPRVRVLIGRTPQVVERSERCATDGSADVASDPMVDLAALRTDLAAEHQALDGRVATLPDADWHRPTPAEGWDVADAVSHLAYFDRSAHLALTEPDRFAEHRAAVAAGAPDVEMGRS